MNLINGNIDNTQQEVVDINYTFSTPMMVVHKGERKSVSPSQDLSWGTRQVAIAA